MNARRISTFLLIVFALASCKKDISDNSTAFLKFYGASGEDVGYDIKQTSDNGFILTGSIQSVRGDNDLMIIRTDEYGNQLWAHTFGDTLNDVGKSIQILSDNGFIVAGVSSRPELNNQVYIIRLSEQGDVVWEKNIGGTNQEQANCVQTTLDGGFVLVGNTSPESTGAGAPPTEEDILLVKLNANGDTVWTSSFGGSRMDQGNFVYEKNDGGFIIIGTTNSQFAFDLPGLSGDNILLVETRSDGKVLDNITYGGLNADLGICVRPATDQGYYILGTSSSFGGSSSKWILTKIGNNIHDILWSEPIVIGKEASAKASSFIVTSENTLAIAGMSYNTGQQNDNGAIAILDADGTILHPFSEFGTSGETFWNIQQTSDKGFVCIGSSSVEGNSMIMLIKLNSKAKLK